MTTETTMPEDDMSEQTRTAIHQRYSVNAFADACRECGEEWPCRTTLKALLTEVCDAAEADYRPHGSRGKRTMLAIQRARDNGREAL